MDRTGSRKWWALAALLPVSLALALDMNVLTLALPILSSTLHATTAQLQWFVDAYNVAIAALMLPAGLFGDRFGRKKSLLLALVVFAVGSVATAFSPSASALIAARAVMGVAAAFVLPLTLANLPVLFTEERERQRAFTWMMVAQMLGAPVGPVLGGWILTHFWWGYVFLMNVPLVALGLIAVSSWLPESRSQERPSLDWPGTLLSSTGLLALVYSAIIAGQSTWQAAGAWAALAVGALSLAVFVLWERRQSSGLINLGLFRSANFTWGAVLATLTNFALFGISFSAPQYFQEVVGTTVLGNGLRQLPMIAGLLLGGVLARRIVPRLGAKLAIAVGFLLMAGGLAMGAATSVQTSYGFVASWLALTGLGLGFALPAAMNASLGALAADRAGVGSAALMSIRQVGGTLGIAVLGAVLNVDYRTQVASAALPRPLAAVAQASVTAAVRLAQHLGAPGLLQAVRSAFMRSMDAQLWVSAAIAILSIVVALLFLPASRRAGADPPAPSSSAGP